MSEKGTLGPARPVGQAPRPDRWHRRPLLIASVVGALVGISLMVVPNLPVEHGSDLPAQTLVVSVVLTEAGATPTLVTLRQTVTDTSERVDIEIGTRDNPKSAALSSISVAWTPDDSYSVDNWYCSFVTSFNGLLAENGIFEEDIAPLEASPELWTPVDVPKVEAELSAYPPSANFDFPQSVATGMAADIPSGRRQFVSGVSCSRGGPVKVLSQASVAIVPTQVIVGFPKASDGMQLWLRDTYSVGVPRTWIGSDGYEPVYQSPVSDAATGQDAAEISRDKLQYGNYATNRIPHSFAFYDSEQQRWNDLMFALGVLLVGAFIGVIAQNASSNSARRRTLVAGQTGEIPQTARRNRLEPKQGFVVVMGVATAFVAGFLLGRVRSWSLRRRSPRG